MLPSPPRLDPNGTNWIVHVNENLNCMPADEQQYWKYPSIFKVPPTITDLNHKAYQPQVVSFGPYHYDNDRLGQMEVHKHRTLLHFLKRSGKSVEPFFESLRMVAPELEDSYNELDSKWKEGAGGKFLELMITDGCFMLEIMRIATMSRSEAENNGYAPNDPIFSIHRLEYIAPYIRRDMLLLENQLPMLVLYQLVAVGNNGKEDDVKELIRKFCFPFENRKFTRLDSCLHVMDVFRKGLLMEAGKDQHKQKKCSTELNEAELVIRATELNEAGIMFERSKTKSLDDISFARGVLKLPLITVDDTTESIFLNAMTFERFHINAGNEVTSYVTFMDKLIKNEQDVALLDTAGIIQNDLGSDGVVAKLFNSLRTEVTCPSNQDLDYVVRQIGEHCQKPWNKWRAHLNRRRADLDRTYFRSPWAIVSLIAAIFLFVLTMIQTVYTVLSYH